MFDSMLSSINYVVHRLNKLIVATRHLQLRSIVSNHQDKSDRPLSDLEFAHPGVQTSLP